MNEATNDDIPRTDTIPVHRSVMPEAVREVFSISPGRVLDATAGAGGHTEILLELGHEVVALDRDPAVCARFEREISGGRFRGRNLTIHHGDFEAIPSLGRFDGILADLGLSSDQLADRSRGFSFDSAGPADMRMDPRLPRTAAEIVAESAPDELASILYRYGEETDSRRISRAIAGKRFESARELAEAIRAAKGGRRGRIDPATRSFQALRIAVNDELGQLDALLLAAPAVLRQEGRLAIIAFHSLEDRRVKRAFAEWFGRCRCPPGFPECRCGMKRLAFPLWSGSRTADIPELEANPRSRSARMRALVFTPGEVARSDERK